MLQSLLLVNFQIFGYFQLYFGQKYTMQQVTCTNLYNMYNCEVKTAAKNDFNMLQHMVSIIVAVYSTHIQYLALNYCVFISIYHTALWSSGAHSAKASIASVSSSVQNIKIKISKAHSMTLSGARFCQALLPLSRTVDE